MTIFEVLGRLKSVKGPDGSGNYLACCPAHDDKKQSLSIKQGEKGVVLKCYAGCGVREICAKIGIEMKDLFDKPKEKPQSQQKRKIVKTYPYTDKDGKLLFEVVRYEPKSFSQRMPDPDNAGQWIWKSCPVQPLYRLPAVNAAIAAGESVCIAEGEKDADTLTRLGYCGTTIAMGAGKWKSQHTEQLQGAKVLLFADNDAPGRAHVKEVSKALRNTAKSVGRVDLKGVWPEMPEKGDVSDLVDALGDQKAKELIEKAIKDAKAVEDEKPDAKTPEEMARLFDDTEAGRLFSQVSGYTVKDGCICQFTADGGMKLLSTFAAIPRKEIARDDGQTVSTGFDIEGWDKSGKSLGTAWVTSREFGSMSWPMENWGFRANILPGNTNKDKLRYAIAEVGTRSAVKHTLYTHTGWREIGGKLMFLHGGGAIGGDDVSVQLEGKLGTYNMSFGAETDAAQAAKSSMGLIDCMNRAVSVPLIATAYLAPLCEFLGKRGIMPRFALFLLGQTQTRKTTAALLALSHFGNFNAQDKIPASFTDTANSVQRSAFLLKDMPILVDDYFPVSNLQARRKMEEMAQTLSRSFGNGASRGRLNSDMTQRAGLPPRGVAIFTGEDLPDIKESGLARYYLVNVEKTSVPASDELTKLQQAAANGELARCMEGYISWLGRNAEKMPDMLYGIFMQMRGVAAKRLTNCGARAPEAVSWLMLGIGMMYRYFCELKLIKKEELTPLCTQAMEILIENCLKQSKEMTEQKPVNVFVRIVSEMLISGRFKCLGVDETSGSINVLGYMDTQFYYFMPEMLYQAVSKFCTDQGTVFPVTMTQLRKQLVAEKLITEDMCSKPKRLRGRVGRYLWIPRGVIDGTDEIAQQESMQMTESDEKTPFED